MLRAFLNGKMRMPDEGDILRRALKIAMTRREATDRAARDLAQRLGINAQDA